MCVCACVRHCGCVDHCVCACVLRWVRAPVCVHVTVCATVCVSLCADVATNGCGVVLVIPLPQCSMQSEAELAGHWPFAQQRV